MLAIRALSVDFVGLLGHSPDGAELTVTVDLDRESLVRMRVGDRVHDVIRLRDALLTDGHDVVAWLQTGW